MRNIQSQLREIHKAVLPKATDVCQAVGISYDTWRAWQTGRRRPSSRNLRALARVLDQRARKLRSLAEALPKHLKASPSRKKVASASSRRRRSK